MRWPLLSIRQSVQRFDHDLGLLQQLLWHLLLPVVLFSISLLILGRGRTRRRHVGLPTETEAGVEFHSHLADGQSPQRVRQQRDPSSQSAVRGELTAALNCHHHWNHTQFVDIKFKMQMQNDPPPHRRLGPACILMLQSCDSSRRCHYLLSYQMWWSHSAAVRIIHH